MRALTIEPSKPISGAAAYSPVTARTGAQGNIPHTGTPTRSSICMPVYSAVSRHAYAYMLVPATSFATPCWKLAPLTVMINSKARGLG